ncbi:MAG: sigma-54 factor interaction domain-containing protein, partial [Oligoflexales bacterium]|nr:sigma-54 factor interaction domain-containing protein [Oligoflexales bacterium]
MSIGNCNSFDLVSKCDLPMCEDNHPLADKDPPGGWKNSFPEIIGRSQPIQQMLNIIYKAARTDSSVLIFGESGTGKELVASAVHRLSNRSHKRFVAINCSAIPETLLESELFGYEKGAFTGALARKPGHFEMASGGTIFLDEIGDMPLLLQAKLLRVLQERQFTPIGAKHQLTADVRIVAATNINLQKAIDEGKFREDL